MHAVVRGFEGGELVAYSIDSDGDGAERMLYRSTDDREIESYRWMRDGVVHMGEMGPKDPRTDFPHSSGPRYAWVIVPEANSAQWMIEPYPVAMSANVGAALNMGWVHGPEKTQSEFSDDLEDDLAWIQSSRPRLEHWVLASVRYFDNSVVIRDAIEDEAHWIWQPPN